jgi:hypothetical protein
MQYNYTSLKDVPIPLVLSISYIVHLGPPKKNMPDRNIALVHLLLCTENWLATVFVVLLMMLAGKWM